MIEYHVANITQYGFRWDDILVERCASSKPGTKPKWLVLRVFALNGEIIEIICRPRSTRVNRITAPRREK